MFISAYFNNKTNLISPHLSVEARNLCVSSVISII